MDYRRFKLGDTVRIRQDLRIGYSYFNPSDGDKDSFYCNADMTSYEGEIAAITCVKKREYGYIYNLSIDSGDFQWEWTDDFLDPFHAKINNAQAAKLFLEKEHAYD